MYKRLLISLFCLLLGLPRPASARALGAIRVIANYLNTEVFLDGEPCGIAPLMLEEIPLGRHTLRFEGAGCEPLVQTVELTPEPLVIRANLHSNLESLDFRLLPETELATAPVSLFLAGGSRSNGRWSQLGIGRTCWSQCPFSLALRGGGMTGVTFTIPYYGLYLEPSLLATRPLQRGLQGYGGIGCRESLLSYRGSDELRNYLTGNLVLGIGFQAWFGEARFGILRQKDDPTRTLEVGIGRVF